MCHHISTAVYHYRVSAAPLMCTPRRVLFYMFYTRKVRNELTIVRYMPSVSEFFFFAPCIVIQICNINPRHAQFSNLCLNSIFDVFYLFRTSWVHHQEGSLYKQLLYGMFIMHLCKQSSRRLHSLPPNTLLTGSEYVEDVKNRIKPLIWKVCISLVYVA